MSGYSATCNRVWRRYKSTVSFLSAKDERLFRRVPAFISDNALKAFEEREYFIGSYVWNLCDFGSASRDEGGKQGQNQKGLVTIDRKDKKKMHIIFTKHIGQKECFVKISWQQVFESASGREYDYSIIESE